MRRPPFIPEPLWSGLRRVKRRADALRAVYASSPARLRPGTSRYAARTREEIDHYTALFSRQDADGVRSRETLVEPVPAAWVEIQRRASELIRASTGKDLTGHMVSRLRAHPGVRMLSLGSGPGGVELVFAREAPEAEYVCLDLNPETLRLGENAARNEGLPVRFEQADLNTVRLPADAFDLVFCHASLHHVLELERLMGQIRQTLRTGGELVVVDILARSGYRMRPETRRVAGALFRTLPARYRVNHTAYPEPRVDADLWRGDTRLAGMECIRSEEVVPLLRKTFPEKMFVPYYALSRRFFDTMYGPNYDLARPLDRAVLDWIWELDCHYLASGELQPESYFAIYAA